MDQDTLRVILREAVGETATEVLQVLLEADRVALRSKHVFGAFLWEQERLLRAEAGNQLGPGGAFHTKGSGREVLPQPAPALRPAPGGRGGSAEGYVPVAVALYAAGVSKRKSAEVMSLLLGHRYSHETVSALTDQVLEKVSAFRQRPLPVALPETLLSPRSGVAYFRGSERGVGQTHL